MIELQTEGTSGTSKANGYVIPLIPVYQTAIGTHVHAREHARQMLHIKQFREVGNDAGQDATRAFGQQLSLSGSVRAEVLGRRLLVSV